MEIGRVDDPPPTISELIDRADALLSAGRTASAAASYRAAVQRSRDAGDLSTWVRAALGSARTQVFGADPGRLPAELYDLLVRITDDADRARIAAALARCWAYAGEPDRAARFSTEAQERAGRTDDPGVIADSLDAALTAHWGPDQLAARIGLASRLDDVTAHALEPADRLRAHLWGLQVAAETLNLPSLHRHLRVIELLGAESPRARFFAASRRCMLQLLHGEVTSSPGLIAAAEAAGREAGLADAWMVVESMKGYTAVQTGELAVVASVAAECEEFGTTEGVPAVCAESAYLWSAAGDRDRAAAMLAVFDADVIDGLPSDMNWLLTVQCVLQAALVVGQTDLIERAFAALGRFPDRAVVNSGAVMFHGVTDDPLGRAAALLGDHQAGRQFRQRAVAGYRRIGARWWLRQLLDHPDADDHDHHHDHQQPTERATSIVFRPAVDGLWSIGPIDRPASVRALKGYACLQQLLRRPGEPVPALELITAGRPTVLQSDLGPTLDRTALTAFRARLDDLRSEIDEAEEWSDLGRIEQLRTEQDALVATIGAATGLAGRQRRPGSSSERARVAVTKSITAAISRIEQFDEPLGRHLRQSIRTGTDCCYLPVGDRPTWILSAPDSTERL